MTEPVYTPVVPPGPVRLKEFALRAYYDAGGEALLWDEVRRTLIRAVGPRASCPAEVEALRVWVDLEHRPTFEHYLRRFTAADAASK